MKKTARDERLWRCIEAAKAAGCGREQIEYLVKIAGYIPYRWQWAFHAAAREADEDGGPTEIGLGGARGPGKSHAVLSQVALDDAQRCKGLKVLFLRQTGASAQESFDDVIQKAVKGRVEYRKSKTQLKFPNGSRIILGGFKDERDIDKYIGIEYDVIVVEELTQLSIEKYLKLKGSLRTSKAHWRPRIYASFNPGGIGHAWVRERFVLPYRAGTNFYIEPDTKKKIVVRFIPSTYRQNPALNKEYIDYLESLGGTLGRAWRDGDWDVFEGQYFNEWSHEQHVVVGRERFPNGLPMSWPKYRSIDISGRDGITSCHWYALDPDGRVWVYREYYYGVGVLDQQGNKIEVGRDYDEHARAITALSEDEEGVQEPYQYTVIDTAAFAKAGYSETAAEVYERNGVMGLIPSAKERVVGWNTVHTYLRWTLSTKPKLQVFDTCVNMIRTLPLLQHDERKPEDINTKGEDHTADELRYFLRTLHESKAPRAMTLAERRLAGLRQQESSQDFSYRRNS